MLNKKKTTSDSILYSFIVFSQNFRKGFILSQIDFIKRFCGDWISWKWPRVAKIKNKKKEGVEKLKIWLTHSRYHLYQPKMKPNGLF